MAVKIEELDEIKAKAKCAKFINTNLHMHTPATPKDWNSRPNQTQKAEDISPEAYFEQLNKTSLKLVAITDHNTIAWCEPLMKLALEGRKKGISELHILPGVEITTYEGPHLIAIFPEDLGKLTEIQNFLIKLGLTGTGNPEDRVSKGDDNQITISKIIKWVVDLGGIMVGPHIHSKDGIWGGVEFRGREDVLNDPCFRILAAPSGDIKLVTDHGRRRLLYKNMSNDRILNSFAFINISDCHRIEDFELDTTWIKVSEPTLEGVKQIIYEPELRVSHRIINTYKRVDFPMAYEFIPPNHITHAHIIGLAVSGGMLDNQKIAFSPHQNSIIGKNYAGKSSVLDCIRFVTDDFSSKDEEAHYKLADRLRGILTEGGQVRAYIYKDGAIYALSRALVTRKDKTHYVIEGSSEVYELIENEFRRQTDMSVHDICNLEAYAQGEVVKIKDNSSKQMIVLDSLSKVDDLLQEVIFDNGDGTTILGRLKKNSVEILKLDEDVISLSEDTQDIEELESEISDLEKLAKSPLLQDIKDWGETENKVKGFIRQLNSLKEEVDSLQGKIPSIEKAPIKEKKVDLGKATRSELEEHASITYKASIEKLSKALSGTALENVIAALELDKTEIQKRKNFAADQFRGESDGDSSQAQLAERITEKKERLSKLNEKLEKLNRYQEMITALVKIRATLLDEFNKTWLKIRVARRQVVDIINENSPDNIVAELLESSDRTIYREKLDEIATKLTSSSNRIANKQTQLDLIAEKFTPNQLIEIVKKGDVTKLVTEALVTDNTAKVLIGMGKADLFDLEIRGLQDRFVIKYQKEGEEAFTPIDAGLSGGEQALALLSVALVPKEIPLIIDQPEDELGTALITKDLVEQIRKVKQDRQLILVTHIANIPVLADSESVIYVQQNIANGEKGITADLTGSLENKEIIARLLELDGGKLAFAKRNERYSIVMKEDEEQK